jgi:hypothetical protein
VQVLSSLGGATYKRLGSHGGSPVSIPQGRAELGSPRTSGGGLVRAPCSSRKGKSVAVRSRKGQPNKRLKLPAPGLGRIPFVPQRTSCLLANFVAPAGWGAAA